MTPFYLLPMSCISVILTILFLVLLSLCYTLTQQYWIRFGKGYAIATISLILFVYFLLHCLLDAYRYTPSPRDSLDMFFAAIPWIAPVVTIVLCIPYIALVLVQIHRRVIDTVTANSIKESLDALPVGLCLYNSKGRIRLTNQRMDQYAEDLTGIPYPDLSLLLGRIHEYAPDMIISLKDGRVLLFSEKQLTNDRNALFELMALDVTDPYEAALLLEKQNTQIDALNQRLHQLNSSITELTIQKEILSAKSRLHNDLGALSIASRLFLEKGPEATNKTRKDLESMWDRTYSVFKKQRQTQPLLNEYELLFQTAADIGFSIQTDGPLPTEEKACKVISAAIHETMVNSIRHGQATELHVHIEDASDGISQIASFTNNGTAPTAPIKESGGLSHLRSLTEHYGFTMELQSLPHYKLTIIYPKE